ncbi:tetratricopeptide repeat protein [Campylobacter troglodytis]|uniref:tetratricopeptide repeat protein n=1 Tax=Campylobacter troglodytis TaxID=654363 RepID=UPI0011577D4D|nr:hypothetical protein [Campylobacter troglodytis]TQR60536.1 hypothetical protein DMC01_05175 [Campylobacter troglodytis]
MDFFFVEYRDPIFSIVILVSLVFMVALGHYVWKMFSINKQDKNIQSFVQKFEISNEHKELLRQSALSLSNLHFLVSVFTKGGEFERAIQICLIALEKSKDKNEHELIFYDLAQLYFKAGFLAKSKEVLLNSLKIRPRNEKALKLLKIVYLRLKDYDGVLEVLDCLFELGVEVGFEKEFIRLLGYKNSNLSLDEKTKLFKEAQISAKNSLAKRFLFENEKIFLHCEFSQIIDLLYKNKELIFLDDEEYFELFCAMKLVSKRENYNFKNKKLKMLDILNESDLRVGLEFSYSCSNCKVQMPMFFYHCPLCYEFGSSKISYEIQILD